MAKGLPKSIIKKYGISKKAWKVYKAKTKTKKKRKGVKMARKKTVRRRRSVGINLVNVGAGKLISDFARGWLGTGIVPAVAGYMLSTKTRRGMLRYAGIFMLGQGITDLVGGQMGTIKTTLKKVYGR